MAKKKNSEFVKPNSQNKDIMEVLLIPVSIVLAGVLIAVSVLYAGSVLLKKDEILTKSNLKSVLAETLGNTTLNTGTGNTATPIPTIAVTADQIKQIKDGDFLKFGNKDSKLTIIEFSDPSCPFCHAAAGKNGALNKQIDQQQGTKLTLVADGGTYVAPVVEIKKLVDENKAEFIWIYANGHGNGRVATQGLYCAQEKGKFWEVHDLYMSSEGYSLINNTVQNDITKAGDLANFTASVIDPTFMKSCLESGKYTARVTSDQALADSFGYSGTPEFYLNTVSFGGAVNYTTMKPTVDGFLNS